LESAFGQFTFSGIAVYIIATIGAIFTTLYSVKVLYLTFLTTPNGNRQFYNITKYNKRFRLNMVFYNLTRFNPDPDFNSLITKPFKSEKDIIRSIFRDIFDIRGKFFLDRHYNINNPNLIPWEYFDYKRKQALYQLFLDKFNFLLTTVKGHWNWIETQINLVWGSVNEAWYTTTINKQMKCVTGSEEAWSTATIDNVLYHRLIVEGYEGSYAKKIDLNNKYLDQWTFPIELTPTVKFRNNLAHEGNVYMTLPLVILAIFSIFFGFLSKDLFIGLGSNFLAVDNSIFIHPNHEIVIDTEFGVPTIFKLLPFFCTIIFSVLSIIVSEYYPEHLINFKFSRLGYNIFGFFNQRFLIEMFYNKYITNLVLNLGGHTTKVIDKGSVELIGPWGLEKALVSLSKNISGLSSGIVTVYGLYILVGFVFYLAVPYLAIPSWSVAILATLMLFTTFSLVTPDDKFEERPH
jgi:NADH:ubiquinone oxidoreductase subunit 5 (subunit L)/multisubunit Na+/H+ antiporter MnhA subunit